MMELWDLIPDAMNKFDFDAYHRDELQLIKPALEKIGYHNIRFSMGERDSFGPLSRVIDCIKDGQSVRFIYG